MKTRGWMAIVAIIVALTSAQRDCFAVCIPGDIYPPSQVIDFAALGIGLDRIMVGFTQPSDASGVVVYDVRYRTVPLTALNWGTATQASGEPMPTTPGTAMAFDVGGLALNTKYYVAIKSQDGCGRWSAMSKVITPPPLAAPPPLAEFVLEWDYSAENEEEISGGGGFRLLYGSKSNTDPTFTGYEQTVDIPAADRTVTLPLDRAKIYYFVIIAYDATGVESSYSNEVRSD